MLILLLVIQSFFFSVTDAHSLDTTQSSLIGKRQAELATTNYPNIQIYSDKKTLYANGSLKCGIVLPGSYFQFEGQQISPRQLTPICFHRNGNIKAIVYSGEFTFSKQGIAIKTVLPDSNSPNNSINFNENSKVTEVTLSQKASLRIKDKDHWVSGKLVFDPDSPDKVLYAQNISIVNSEVFIFQQGFTKKISKTDFHNNSIIKSTTIAKEDNLNNFFLAGKTLKIHGKTNFHENGNISSTHLTNNLAITIAGRNLVIQKSNGTHKYGQTYFNRNGTFRRGRLDKDVRMKIIHSYFVISAGSWVEFAPSGQLLATKLPSNASFKNALGHNIPCKAGDIRLYANGFLRSCRLAAEIDGLISNNITSHIKAKVDTVVSFNPAGYVIEATFSPNSYTLSESNMEIVSKFLASDDENLLQIYSKTENNHFRVQDKWVKFGIQNSSAANSYTFHDNGDRQLSNGILAENITLNVIGGTRDFYQGEAVCFNEDGLAASKLTGSCNW